jgi:hypothetical protein
MFAVGRQQTQSRWVEAAQECFQEFPGQGENLMEIDDAKFQRRNRAIETVQKALIPDITVSDVVASLPPCFLGRIVAGLFHAFFPAFADERQRVVRAEHDVANLAVLKIARLGHHNHVGSKGRDTLFKVLQVCRSGGFWKALSAPGEQRAVEDQIALVRAVPGATTSYQASFIVIYPAWAYGDMRLPSREVGDAELHFRGEQGLPLTNWSEHTSPWSLTIVIIAEFLIGLQITNHLPCRLGSLSNLRAVVGGSLFFDDILDESLEALSLLSRPRSKSFFGLRC